MQIVVTFTGPLRTAGPVELSVSEGTTLAGICRLLADTAAGDVRRHLLSAAGGLEPTLLVAVNGVGVPLEERPRRILLDGDDVLIMPPVAGG